jgi:hypothetical protein
VETKKTTSYTVLEHGSIDKELRNIIRIKNEHAIEYVNNNDSENIRSMMSELCLGEDPENFNSSMVLVSKMLNSNNFNVIKEYHIQASEKELNITIKANFKNDTNKFTINFTTPGKDSYLTLMTQNVGGSEMLITTLYGLYNNEWKLDAIKTSNLTAHGRTSPENYYLSKKYKEQGKLLAAFNFISLSRITKDPAFNLITYDAQKEIEQYTIEIIDEITNKYTFPLHVSSVKSMAEIIGLQMEHTSDLQYFPLVLIKSKIDISIKDLIRVEGESILENIEETLPSYTYGFSHIFLTFCNDLPDEDGNFDTYSLLLETPKK